MDKAVLVIGFFRVFVGRRNEIGGVRERALFGPDVNEGGLDSRLHRFHTAQIDVANHAPRGGISDVNVPPHQFGKRSPTAFSSNIARNVASIVVAVDCSKFAVPRARIYPHASFGWPQPRWG